MKKIFKPLGLAVAVAAVTAGYAGAASAQTTRAAGNVGDLGIIPYYTVEGNWVTGVHIINTSDLTQVVKLRLRRALDSADALDFNLIMSPKDEWTGFIDDSSGDLVFATDDNTCTAPIRENGRFPMPAIFREGANEGYIEVIGMGSASSSQPISINAEHELNDDGERVPVSCTNVASNFFANGISGSKNGVIDNANTVQKGGCPGDPSPSFCNNTYGDASDALKVSYFFRDANAGTEMGGNAVHIAGFSDEAWMSNQETGLFSGDLLGFDYPDLNGGPIVGTDESLRGTFDGLRAPELLGVAGIVNDWSVAAARNVSTDWVVTMPGQYTMVDYYVWAQDAGLDFENCAQPDNPSTAVDESVNACDFRDLPVTAALTLYDREEGEIVPDEGDLVISPAPPSERNELIFPYEVNVIEWTTDATEPVLSSNYNTTVDPSVLGEFGWASLAVSSTDLHPQEICVFDGVTVVPGSGPRNICDPVTNPNVPIVGFVAWQRSFPSNPDANYGRLIDHSFNSGITSGD